MKKENISTPMISEGKMHFRINDHRPKLSKSDRQTVETEIEKQLFSVFSKYA
jgi:hypothetical protein